ncbi:hypothetical protein ACVNPZ_07075 [Staphylococcus aureus]
MTPKGGPQTLHANLMIRTLKADRYSDIGFVVLFVLLLSIKHLGTNGGGFLQEILQHLSKLIEYIYRNGQMTMGF